MTTRWEYLIIPLPMRDYNSLEEKLLENGRLGWELITIIQSSSLKNSLRIESDHFAIFKRPQISDVS